MSKSSNSHPLIPSRSLTVRRIAQNAEKVGAQISSITYSRETLPQRTFCVVIAFDEAAKSLQQFVDDWDEEEFQLDGSDY